MEAITQLSHEQEQLKFVSRREAESMFQQKGNGLTLMELLAAMYRKGRQDTLDSMKLNERVGDEIPSFVGTKEALDSLTIKGDL